jgi:3-deoxy-7-phosphoheptulonate synthase
MIIAMKSTATQAEIEQVIREIEKIGSRADVNHGDQHVVIGLAGDWRGKTTPEHFLSLPGVENALPILKPYKQASRAFHPKDTVVSVDGIPIGPGHFEIIAGPCAIETDHQLMSAAQGLKERGVRILRAGAFKPRSSPYSFQGLGLEGLRLLQWVKRETGLKIVTEALHVRWIDAVADCADMIQIGARNMQNYDLLREVAKAGKPVLLKRGFQCTISELLMSADYLLDSGCKDVVLCERGVRGFDSEFTRNVLDIAAVPVLQKESHLPVMVDPSHAAGRRDLIRPLSMAAAAVGAHGLLIEVHTCPEEAMCDGPQQLTLSQFSDLMASLRPLLEFLSPKP